MIVSHRHRYIFVHIPKTGGTALSLKLEERVGPHDILIGDTPKARRRRRRLTDVRTSGRLWKHSRLADIGGLVGPEEVASFFVFTLVRNPWDRLVSYYHWLRVQDFNHPAVALARSSTFTEFVNDPGTIKSLSATPYASYLRDGAGRERCDLYARIEHLDTDLAPFETHVGWSVGSVAKINVSDREPDYRTYYTAADRDLVGRIAAPDIARFGYTF